MNQYFRLCPACGSQKTYTSELSYKNAVKKNTVCRRCAAEQSGFLNRDNHGVNNSFYGKKHSATSKEKMSASHIGAVVPERRKEQLSQLMSGSGNPMYGKSLMDVWEGKYGTHKAQILRTQWLNKMSASLSGDKNPMFGKPTPTGAGCGWSGWYKGWYFRSLGELSYVVNVLEQSNQHWISAEAACIRIEYTHWNGSKRTYIPDFLVEQTTLIECKPERLHHSPLVKLKRKAAEEYCKENNLQYQIISPPMIDTAWLISAVDSGTVRLLRPYNHKLNDYRNQYD
jgi:hypothetical protein